jgi:hypothetical protein
MTRVWPPLVFLALLLLGCRSGEDSPPPHDAVAGPWIEVTLVNRTDERVVEATLSPFDTPAFVQQAIDQTLEPGGEVLVRVRAGTWSLRYVTESGRETSEPALELNAARTIPLE